MTPPIGSAASTGGEQACPACAERDASHTPGSIAVRRAERGLLFTGDTAAEREGAVFLGPFDIDRERAKESFRRLAEPGIVVVCFGHGDPLVGKRVDLLQTAANSPEIPDPLG